MRSTRFFSPMRTVSEFVQLMLATWLGITLLTACSLAQAQEPPTIQFSAQTTVGDGKVIPVLTWSTTPAATSCTASGNWSGELPASGTRTLPEIQQSGTYNISCKWDGVNWAKLIWTPPALNTNATPYTDPKGWRIYYSQNQSAVSDANIPMVDPSDADLQVANILEADAAHPTDSAQRQYLLNDLAAGLWYFRVAAVNSRDVAGGPSPVKTKTTTSGQGVTRSVGVTVNPIPGQVVEFEAQ